MPETRKLEFYYAPGMKATEVVEVDAEATDEEIEAMYAEWVPSQYDGGYRDA